MEITDDALVLTLLPHGEHGAIVRFLCFAGGLRPAYVHGVRSRARRALFAPGNRVALRLRARQPEQLPTASAELIASRALIAFDADGAAILHWLSALVAATLAEAVPQPHLTHAFDALLDGLVAGLSGVPARAALARFELLLLQESGFALDLTQCAMDGPADDLAYVSPHSGRAISQTMATGQPWQHRLLPLPRFLWAHGPDDAVAVRDALALTGHFLFLHWHLPPRLQALRERAARLG